MKRNFGYTLVEVLIISALILFVASIGINSYFDLNRRQSIDQMAKKIASDIRLSQSMALNQQKPIISGFSCVKLNGYKFEVDRINKIYTIQPVCEWGVGGPPPEGLLNTKRVDFSNSNLTVNGFYRIVFGIAQNLARIDDSDEITKDLVITRTGSNFNKKIVVNVYGEVYVQ